MKLYISADIEGVAGVVTYAQTVEDGFEYADARRWMTGEVAAACEAAMDHGVTSIVVSDSHGNGQNLLLDELPDNVRVVRSWPRPLNMMQGLEEGGFVGAFLIGYHTGVHHSAGVLSHTMATRVFTELRLNGVPACETVLSAALANRFDTPILLATGDEEYIAGAQEILGDVAYVATKKSYGRLSVQTVTPARSRALISDAVPKALAKVGHVAPYELEPPIVFEADFQRKDSVELLDYLPGVERIASHTIRFETNDIVDVIKLITFIVTYKTEV